MQDQLTFAGAVAAPARPGPPWPDDDGPVLRPGFTCGRLRAPAERAALGLLAGLAAADPGRYGDWSPGDLRGFLRLHGAVGHTIDIGGDRRNKRAGYWLEEVTRAIEDPGRDPAAPGVPAALAA